jgi:DNA polymerase III sliding clamp (beta) subunit (PCNA family)
MLRIVREDFIDALEHALHAASADRFARPKMCTVCFQFGGDALTIVATDTYRVAGCTFEAPGAPEREFMIGKDEIKAVVRLLKAVDAHVVELEVVEEGIKMRSEKLSYLMEPAILSGEYAEWRKVDNRAERRFTIWLNPKHLYDAVRQMKNLSKVGLVVSAPEDAEQPVALESESGQQFVIFKPMDAPEGVGA